MVIRWLGRLWRSWLRSAVLVVALVSVFRSAVADWNDVPSGSMRPSILVGDRIVVNKLAYDLRLPFSTHRLAVWDDPARGDVIVLLSPADGKRLVKRVVGLPGDSLAMIGGHLVINGEPIGYAPLQADLEPGMTRVTEGRVVAAESLGQHLHPVMITPRTRAPRSFGPVTVPSGTYFVMGDNRDESFDSRYFGPVSRRLILGRAVAVAASVDPQRFFMPRWRRFLRALP